MKVTSIVRGRTLIKVIVEADRDNDSIRDIADFAIAEAGETHDSLFGHHVTYWPGSENFSVDLYTD